MPRAGSPRSAARNQYEYTINDHLGNARLCFADLNANGIVDVPGDILQENHYYPFGMNMNYGWLNAAALDNRYQYNGKELNDDFGLNWSDYGARWYEASVGRWWSVDSLIDQAPNWTPYRYAFNNPIRYTDPNGMFETEAAAKEYAKEHNIKVNRFWHFFGLDGYHKITKMKDGTFSITMQGSVEFYYGYKKGDFETDKAINKLNSNAEDKSVGKCAKYVRIAIEAGGRDTNGRPISAKDYDGYIQKKGFYEIESEEKLKKGDIAIMQDFKGEKKDHPHGHIQMWNGSQWVSDFKQNDFWPGSDYKKSKPKFKLLRPL